jgi:hypothetical protein
MGCLTTQKKAELKPLDAAYREAWSRLLLHVSYWQSLGPDTNPGSAAVKKAWHEVERAEVSYRQSRNRLAEYLLPSALKTKELVNC